VVNGRADAVPNVFLFGDSHSLSVFPALETVAANHGFVAAFTAAPGCLPFLGIFTLGRDDQETINCHDLNTRVFEYVRSHRIQTVILAARWTYYTDGRYAAPNALQHIGLTPLAPTSKTASRQTFVHGLHETVDAYRSLGTRLLIMTQVPMQLGDPRRAYFLATRSPFGGSIEDWIRRTSVTVMRHRELQSFVEAAFRSWADQKRVELLDPTDTLCIDGLCRFGDATTSYYYDSGHLSLPGSVRLVPLLEQALSPRRARLVATE
jgi:hypothetical protein